MKQTLNQTLRSKALIAYQLELKTIPKKLLVRDKLKKAGELWILKDYGRTYSLDKILPFYLILRLGPQEKDFCKPITFFLEDIEETLALVPSDDRADYDQKSVTIYYPNSCIKFEYPNSKTCELIEKKIDRSYTERIYVCS